MAEQPQFSQHMYANLDDALGSRNGADVIWPLVLDLVRPRSVLDVGCGVGSWLASLAPHGISDIHGVDSPFVQDAHLVIPREKFTRQDLRLPLDLKRTFDLVMCLEVAADIPHDESDAFVATLVRHGNVQLFSTAIPYQAGSNTGRVNQQWPAWWAKKFAAHGFVPVDAIRHRIWQNPNVMWWYKQNLLLFVHESVLANNPALKAERAATRDTQLSLVHPERFLIEMSFRTRLAGLPTALGNALKRRRGEDVDEFDNF